MSGKRDQQYFGHNFERILYFWQLTSLKRCKIIKTTNIAAPNFMMLLYLAK